jgi:hypothetical protein
VRSEIPQIEVITAISDADFEDFVAQLLYSQGWSIIYRAFDSQSLLQLLEERRSLRTVIVYMADLPGFTSNALFAFEDSPFTFISLDGSEPAAHAIMQKIRSQLRLPLLQRSQSESALPIAQAKIAPKIYTITGSTTGRLTLAIALGEELASKSGGGRDVVMIDAEFRSQSLARKLAQGSKRLRAIALDPSLKPRALPELINEECAIIDIGRLPSLGEAVHDRRWHGNLISSILETTTHLLYILSSTEESLDELSQFLKEFPILLRKIPITYICILVGSSRELRQAEERFLTLTTAENRFLIRESQLSGGSPLLGSLGGAKTSKSEIGKIAQSLR